MLEIDWGGGGGGGVCGGGGGGGVGRAGLIGRGRGPGGGLDRLAVISPHCHYFVIMPCSASLRALAIRDKRSQVFGPNKPVTQSLTRAGEWGDVTPPCSLHNTHISCP